MTTTTHPAAVKLVFPQSELVGEYDVTTVDDWRTYIMSDGTEMKWNAGYAHISPTRWRATYKEEPKMPDHNFAPQ